MIQFPTQTLINGLQTRKLGLLIAATPDLFKRRVIKLRCSATLLLTYQFEATRVITGGGGGGGGGGYTGDSGHFDPSSLDSSGESGKALIIRSRSRTTLEQLEKESLSTAASGKWNEKVK